MKKIIIILSMIFSPLSYAGAVDTLQDAFNKIKDGEILNAASTITDGVSGSTSYLIGKKYEFGELLFDKNINQAIKWYNTAAQSGNKDAKRRLSYIYYFGKDGVEKDYIKAEAYLRDAAHGNSVDDSYWQNLLGVLYEHNGKVELALRWYEKSCHNGDYKACENMKSIRPKAILKELTK